MFTQILLVPSHLGIKLFNFLNYPTEQLNIWERLIGQCCKSILYQVQQEWHYTGATVGK